jgi:isochorismate synthase EntC
LSRLSVDQTTASAGAADSVDAAIRQGTWWSDGERSVVGTGPVRAWQVAACEAGDAIRRAVADGADGAFFSAGFEPGTPTTILVPEALTVEPAAPLPAAPIGRSATRVVVTANSSAEAWAAAVADAAAAVRDPGNDLAKVVLTRELRVRADTPIDPRGVVGRLAGTFPQAFLYSIGGVVGASPELLGQAFDGRFSARALAGTIGRAADPDLDAAAALGLLRSAKDRHEHGLLAAWLAERLDPLVADLRWSEEPSVLTLANVHHLMTEFDGRLRPALARPGGLVDLVAAVHPTPAVAGVPQAAALAWIAAHEARRGRLNGFAGWCDRRGDGQAALVIRSLELDGTTARLVVGNGIVGDSDPAAEVLEVQAKARGVLDAVSAL